VTVIGTLAVSGGAMLVGSWLIIRGIFGTDWSERF
jgi:hypothetical protein